MKSGMAKILVLLVGVMMSVGVWGQSGIVGDGFTLGWADANIVGMTASVGGSQIVTRNPTGINNRFFRLIRNGNVNMSPSAGCVGGGDQTITANPNTSLTIANSGPCGNGAWYIDCPNTTDNYVFKVPSNNSSSSFVYFRVQGAVRIISSVTQSQPTVYINQQILVTATLNDNLNNGQAVYLRYSTDGFATSTVLSMTGSGTTYTATLPGYLAGTIISYYTFTSGNSNVANNGSNADYFTINLNNNSGTNYSYTVQNGYASDQTGDWNVGTTWAGGAVPPVDANAIILNGHNVTLNGNATLNSLQINTGATFTASDATAKTLTFLRTVTGTSLTNNGTWANGIGGSTVDFRSDNTITHTISGTIGFQNVSVTRNSGTPNIGVSFSAGSTINGNFQINAGGFVTTSNAPNYAGGSTLIYATGGTYGRGAEWSATTGRGYPANVTITNNSTLDLPNSGVGNGAARNCAGDLIINSGSVASMSGVISTGNMTAALTVGGNVLVNGSLILSGTANGNLTVAGNFTNGGSFTANGRIVTFNGTANQNITGNTTFSTIVNSNTAGVVNIPNGTTITITTTGTFSNANTTTSIDGTIGNQGAIAGLFDATRGLRFNASGIYNHNLNSGSIPFATWATSSNCNVNGMINTQPGASSFVQTFGNLTWNCTGQTGIANFTGNLTSIAGDLNVQSTGTSFFRLNTSTPSTIILNIGGDLNQTGGTIDITNGGSTVTLNISGDFFQTAGTLNLGNGSTGTGILKVAGSFTQSVGATINEGSSSSNHVIEFNGSLNQSVELAGTVTNEVDFRCNNSAGITITGNLPINNGATFFRTQGAITGNIAYHTTASTLAYDGIGLTTNDVEWPATFGPLSVNINTTASADEIFLHNPRTIATTLTLTNGRLVTGNHDLTISNTAVAAIVWVGNENSYVSQTGTGQLIRSLSNSGSQSYNYPVGDASGLANLIYFSVSNNTAGRLVGFRTIDGTSPNINTPNTPPDYLNRYWVSTVSPTTGSYSYRFSSMAYQTGEFTGNADNIKISSYLSGAWTDATTTGPNPLVATSNYTQLAAPLDGGHFSGRNSSATYTWTGFTNNSWATTTNWSPNGFPSPTDNIIVDIPGTNQLFINELREISSATLNASGVINIEALGNLTTPNFTFGGTAILNMNAGAELHLQNSVTYSGTPATNIDCGSTVWYERLGTQTIMPLQYGNLNALGGARTFSGVTTSICGLYTRSASTTTLTGSTVVYNGSAIQTIQGGTGHNYANLVINNSAVGYNLLNANTTVTVSLTINANSRLDIQTHTLTLTGASSSINGTLRNAGTITGGLNSFNATGKYEHSRNGGVVPTATWNTGSVCEILGVTNTVPSGVLGQNFHHFYWNCGGQTTGILGLNSSLTNIAGNFEILNANGNALSLSNASPVTLTVGGNLILQGGSLHLTVGGGAPTLLIGGNLTIDVARNITKGSGSGDGLVEFNGGTNQLITIPGAGNIVGQVNFRLNNAAGITIPNGSTLPINANATFYRSKGAIALAGSGNIQYTSLSSTLEYNTSDPGITTSSAEWPDAGHNRIRINSSPSTTIVLHDHRQITSVGNIDFAEGILDLDNFNLTIQNNAENAVDQSGGYAETSGSGQLIRTILSNSPDKTYLFPVGNTAYTPVSYLFATNSLAGRQLGVRCVADVHPYMGPPNPPNYLNNRYWVTTLSDAGGTYSYTPTYIYNNGDIFGNFNNVRLSRWNGSVWSNTSNSSASTTSMTTALAALSQITGSLANAEWSGRTIKTLVDYTWSLGGTGSWISSANWTPNGIPTTGDIVRFNHAGNYNITNIPVDITLSKLSIAGTGTTNLYAGAAGTVSFSGGSNALEVAANASLVIRGTNASDWILLSGSTGSVAGTVVLRGEGSNTAHSIQAANAGAIVFSSGSKFEAGVFNTTNYSGNPFGLNATAGSVVFQNGAVFEQFDGGNPFGNNNVVDFETGSLYRFSDNSITAPSFSARNYANFEYNSTANKSVTGGSAFTMDNLTVTLGTFNINMTGSPGHAIRGHITVSNGANLNFSPASACTINLSGSGIQNISGAGGLSVNADATLQVTNSVGVNLQKDIVVNGALNIAANGIFNATATNIVTGTGSFNLLNNGIFGVGSPDGLFGSVNSGNIRTTNRTVSSRASVRYNGATAQSTGDFITTPTGNTLKAIYVNNPAGVSLSAASYGISLDSLGLETGNFSIGSGQQVNIVSGGRVKGSGGDLVTGINGGTINFLGAGSFSGNCNPYNVYTSGGVDFGAGNVTIQNGGAFRINSGGSANTNGPFYDNGSRLEYNTGGSFTAATEWYANSTTGRGIPHHVQIGTAGISNSVLTFGSSNAWRSATGDITIGHSGAGSGYGFTLSTVSIGDVRLEGNWIRHSNGTFNPNNRAVFFTGNAGNQTITYMGGGNETFSYFIVNKPVGNVQLNNSPATNVTVNGTLGGDVLQLLQGNLDLNGRVFELGGDGGNFRVDGGLREVFSVSPSIFRVIGDKVITSTGGGTLLFDNQTTVEIAAGLNFGASVTTLNATLQINANGFVNANAPIYGPDGRLVYNTGGTYLRRVEWSGDVPVGPGFPNDVVLQNNTTLWASGENGDNENVVLTVKRDLQIDAGSQFRMDGADDMLEPLVVGRDLIINGTIAASENDVIDIYVGRDWTRGASGLFIPNNKAVFFNTNQDATIDNGGGPETFPYVIIDKAGGTSTTLTLAAPVDIENKLTLTSGRVITNTTNLLTITNRLPDDEDNGIDYNDNNTSGYVDGPLNRLVQDSDIEEDRWVFPVGKLVGSDHYIKRFKLKTLSEGNGEFSGEFFRAVPPIGPGPTYVFDVDVQGIRSNEYWQIDRSEGFTEGRIVLPYRFATDNYWMNMNQGPISPPATNPPMNIAIVQGNTINGDWFFTNTDSTAFLNYTDEPQAVAYTTVSAEISSRLLTSFSPFTFGFGSSYILPLHLLTFTATLHGPDALLHWTLADAKDLKQFEVEHSHDGQVFTRLATVGHNGGTDYKYRHTSLQPGVHYYRLKMVEKDGRSGYSKVEVLMVNTNRTLITGLMQNPIQGGQAVVKIYSATNQDAEAVVLDMAGRMLLRQKLSLQTGYNQPSLSLLLLPSGMYKLLIRTRDGVEKVITVMK